MKSGARNVQARAATTNPKSAIGRNIAGGSESSGGGSPAFGNNDILDGNSGTDIYDFTASSGDIYDMSDT